MRAQFGVQGDSQTEELRERIWWLVRLRWAAAAGVTVVVWSVPRLVGVPLAERPLYLITAGLAGYNLVLWVASYRLPFAARPFLLKAFANLQIGVDLLFLTALLHFAGGIENPLVCYYVFHIVIASILLSRRATYAHTVLALGLVSLMAGLEATGRIAHYHLAGFTGSEHYRSPTYVFAILLVVGSMLTFTAFMATSITAQLRRREGEVVRLSQSLQEHTADLERAYEELSRLERGKSEYLHRVAHHLRSPLAALERMLAVVSEGRTGPLNEKSHEMIVRVESGCAICWTWPETCWRCRGPRRHRPWPIASRWTWPRSWPVSRTTSGPRPHPIRSRWSPRWGPRFRPSWATRSQSAICWRT